MRVIRANNNLEETQRTQSSTCCSFKRMVRRFFRTTPFLTAHPPKKHTDKKRSWCVLSLKVYSTECANWKLLLLQPQHRTLSFLTFFKRYEVRTAFVHISKCQVQMPRSNLFLLYAYIPIYHLPSPYQLLFPSLRLDTRRLEMQSGIWNTWTLILMSISPLPHYFRYVWYCSIYVENACRM